jgi:hypothetical protein
VTMQCRRKFAMLFLNPQVAFLPAPTAAWLGFSREFFRNL